MIIPEEVTFEEAIALTKSLIDKISRDEISLPEVSEAVSSLVNTQNGARGFFVTYLTSEGTLADNPSPEIIEALACSPEIVAELLVKNLAMSAAMAVAHLRNHNQQMARESQRVKLRTLRLIEKIDMPQLLDMAAQLRESALTWEGSYKLFLQRWQYDAEQREAICQAIDRMLPSTTTNETEGAKEAGED
ncbi:MAG: hypothetical protein F6K36_10250 [Symploca sp. SIO3C6]|nr:hypothetical protein [Symploca sp. SIO3C6]